MNADATHPRSPALFASVRSSGDGALAAFAAALLVAFALHAGAFLPKLAAPQSTESAPAIEVAPQAPVRSVVARRPLSRSATVAAPKPCRAPRG
jgi:hypothetical protein